MIHRRRCARGGGTTESGTTGFHVTGFYPIIHVKECYPYNWSIIRYNGGQKPYDDRGLQTSLAWDTGVAGCGSRIRSWEFDAHQEGWPGECPMAAGGRSVAPADRDEPPSRKGLIVTKRPAF